MKYRIVVSDEVGNTVYQTEEPDQHHTMEEAYRDLDVVSNIRNIVVESISIQVSVSKTRETRIEFIDENYDRKSVKRRYSDLYTHMGNRGDRCTYCDSPFSTELDHVPPLKHVEKLLSLGESAVLGLYPSCKRCNTSLGSIPLLDIKSRKRFILMKLEIESLMFLDVVGERERRIRDEVTVLTRRNQEGDGRTKVNRVVEKITCLFCETEFPKKRRGHKFCTMKCETLWHSEYSERIKVNRVDKKCLFCGMGFTKMRHWQKFCTPKCTNLWHSERRRKGISLLENVKNETGEKIKIE